MVTTKKSGGKAFAATLWLGLGLLFAACQPPGPKALLDGERLIREGEYERALKRLNKAAELLPTNAQVWNHIGLAQHGLGNHQEAVKAYNQALRLDRDLAVVHFNLGTLFLDVNRLPDAINRLRVFTTVQPDQPEGWLKLGTALLRSGNPDHAEGAFMRALERAPKNPEIHNNLGLVHVQRKRPRDAMRCFRNALELDPNYAPAILNQAIVEQHHLDDKRAALATYQRYLQTKPAPRNTPEVQTIIAELNAQLNPRPVQVAAARTNPPPAVARTNQAAASATAPATNVASARPPTTTTNVAVAKPPVTNPPAVKPPEPEGDTQLAMVDNTRQDSPEPESNRRVDQSPQEQKPAARAASAEPETRASETPKPSTAAAEQPKPSEAEAKPVSEPKAAPKPETRPEPEPEPEPEPIPVEVVEIEQDPVFRPVVPPADNAATTTNNPAADTQSRQLASAVSTTEEPPLLIPRRVHSGEEEESGLLDRVNPMRLFRRDRERSSATAEPLVDIPPPARRPVPEEPAEPPARQAKPLPPNLPRYQYQQNLQITAGNRTEAERLFLQGAQAHQEKRYLAAIELYKRAVGADPAHFEANYNLGLAAFQAGNLPQALAANEKAVKLKPDSANARFNFALTLREANYPLDAVKELQDLLTEAPNEVRAHFAMANIYAQELDQPLLAEEHYQRVLQLQPNHPDAARIRQWLAYSE